jgi:hypothetical protein
MLRAETVGHGAQVESGISRKGVSQWYCHILIFERHSAEIPNRGFPAPSESIENPPACC